MQKQIIAAVLIAILAVPLASCRETPPVRIPDEVTSADLQSDPSAPESGELYGITQSGLNVYGERYYFSVTAAKRKKHSDGSFSMGTVNTVMYINLRTGGSGFVCPDPLCSHTTPEECPYADLENLTFVSNDVFFAVRTSFVTGEGFRYNLYKGDLSKNKVSVAYEPEHDTLTVVGAFGGRLYFKDTKREVTADGDVYSSKLKCIDGESGKVTDYGFFPDKYSTVDWSGDIFFIGNDTIFMSFEDRIFTVDMNFENETLLYETGKGQYLRGTAYDSVTGEIFFNTATLNYDAGAIYVWKSGEVRELKLPQGVPVMFQLSRDKLYYSVYDPLYLGVSVAQGNPKSYDDIGGRIYSVDRAQLGGGAASMETELIFDGVGETIISTLQPYLIYGDYLHIANVELVREFNSETGMEYVYKSVAHDSHMIRINMKTGEKTTATFADA